AVPRLTPPPQSRGPPAPVRRTSPASLPYARRRNAMIRAFIVDDERLAVQRLTRMLSETGRVEIAGSTIDPEEALAFLTANKVDVLFLDIQMPSLTGFELLEQLAPAPVVVFTTAYDAYALNAFE